MWRDLNPMEIASLPEARLGGALMAMQVLAVLSVVTVFVVAVASIGVSVGRGSGMLPGGPRNLTWMLAIAPSAFAVVLAAVFAIMTLARARATPIVLSAGMIIWLVLRLLFGVYNQFTFAAQVGASTFLALLWPIFVSVTTDGIAVAALCAYMADGTRPNAYYRRRMRTGR